MGDAVRESRIIREKLKLEAKAEALLRRLRSHNTAETPLTEFEIRSVLKEARAIRSMSLADAVATDALDRINLIVEQAVAEAKTIVAGIGRTKDKRQGQLSR